MIPPPSKALRIPVIQGEWRVSADPRVSLTTILGSCVAACMFDPVAGVGGMNHFLLPGEEGDARPADGERYGVHLMELLVNGLMQIGAQRGRLQAKLFGGARVVRGLSDIGGKNGAFAARYLAYEGVELVGQDLGGAQGRRLHFSPTTGRARVSYIARDSASQPPAPPPRQDFGDIELFSRL